VKILIFFQLFVFFCHAAEIVLPPDLATQDGNAAGGLQFANQRSQQGYARGLFSAVAAPAIEIYELRFRVDPGARPFSTTAEIEVRLSTTQQEPEFLNPNYAANIGGDEVIAMPRSSIALQGNPGLAFDVVIPLPNHFVYSPARGNLLVDMTIFTFGPQSTSLDLVDQTSDGIGTIFGLATNPGGLPSTTGFVTEVTFNNVPEPAVPVMLVIGFSALLGFNRYVTSRRLS
jgi:hypothetical protein